jgi:hypothetical protein
MIRKRTALRLVLLHAMLHFGEHWAGNKLPLMMA